MKKLSIFIVSALMIYGLSPIQSMEHKMPIEASDKKIRLGYANKAPYETYLKCTYFKHAQGLTQGTLKIYEEKTDKEIGQILLQYYPSGECYGWGPKTPELRLRQIEIDGNFRKQHHCTRALETLFKKLRMSDALPENTEICTEYSTILNPYMDNLFNSFGFKKTKKIWDIQYASVKLKEVKFPYYKKSKEKNN